LKRYERGCLVAWRSFDPAVIALERDAMLETLAQRERDAHYPAVLRAPRASDLAVVRHHERAQSRLTTVALLHSQLTPEQYDAIGRFRLRQYMLCGLYDPLYATGAADASDPSLETLAPEAIHVCCGTEDGRLLAYMCMETARPRTSVAMPAWWSARATAQEAHHGETDRPGYTFGVMPRPLFATEFELFGPGIFGSLPYLRGMDVSEARELSRMLRNQVLASPLSIAATVEIILVMFSLATNPALGLRATVGCLGREGRALLAQLGVPVLYAPDAQVLPQQVVQARATRGSSCWSDGANAQGQFWPFVVASADLRRNAAHFAQLDEMLALRIGDVRRGLVTVRRAGRMIAPETLFPGLASSPVRWTADATDGKIHARAPGSGMD
jgi:hypothetical protein